MEKIHNNASALNCPNGIKNLETWRNAKLDYYHALADAKATFDLAQRVAHECRESARATWHASSHPQAEVDCPSNLPCDSCFAGCQNYRGLDE